jgi:hypothetical protein
VFTSGRHSPFSNSSITKPSALPNYGNSIQRILLLAATITTTDPPSASIAMAFFKRIWRKGKKKVKFSTAAPEEYESPVDWPATQIRRANICLLPRNYRVPAPQVPPPSSSGFLALPQTTINLVANYLDFRSLSSLTRTSRRLHRLLTPALFDRLLLLQGSEAPFGFAPDQRDFLLLKAIEKGSPIAARSYLSMGASPNIHESHPIEWSALQLSIAAENTDQLVSLLLKAGADVAWMSGDGLTALHVAALRGKLEAVKIICGKHGGELDRRDPWGQTPLHLAAGGGYVEVVRFLLEMGADSRCRDDKGKTPLVCAGGIGAWDCVALLAEGWEMKELAWIERGLVNRVSMRDLKALGVHGRDWEVERETQEVRVVAPRTGIMKSVKK